MEILKASEGKKPTTEPLTGEPITKEAPVEATIAGTIDI